MGDAVPRASSRRRIVLGASLKQYLDVDKSVRWARALADIARAHPAVMAGDVHLFVLPSLPALTAVGEAIEGSPIALGAQDLFWEDRGAYTGGVSGADLARLGCRYVEVGHAERRQVFGEDATVTRRKFAAAVRNGLTPVLCVGERERQHPDAAGGDCVAQLDHALSDVTGRVGDLVVAYEPEWAIGQAEPADAAHVDVVIRRLRDRLDELGTRSLGDEPLRSVIYGGSAKPGVISSLGSSTDGLFLGRFAHDPASFLQIIDEAAAIMR